MIVYDTIWKVIYDNRVCVCEVTKCLSSSDVVRAYVNCH